MQEMQPDNYEPFPIGGYFELELPIFKEYHDKALALNNGRLCLEYLLRCRKYDKVYVPYYTCDSVTEPIIKIGISYKFYHIDKAYHIAENIDLKENEALIYTNYWGLQNDYCKQLAARYGKRLIFDNTQAFFARPIEGIDTFYSCRKFFGVPDGGYLYTDCMADFDIPNDESWLRMDSLTKRIDLSPEAGYGDFHKISRQFHGMPIRRMSKLTTRLMRSIDYERVAQRRIENYNRLRNRFGGRRLVCGEVPMVFPYTTETGQELRKHLIENKVFVARYWPNVDLWASKDSTEVWMSNHVLPLPIDQRYDRHDMDRIIKTIETI